MDDMRFAEYEYYMKNRPHVVILGAGASCAAIPNGDKNGKRISAMSGFIDKLGFGHIGNSNINFIYDFVNTVNGVEGLVGQSANFSCNNSKSLSCLTCSCCLNVGVKSQKVSL